MLSLEITFRTWVLFKLERTSLFKGIETKINRKLCPIKKWMLIGLLVVSILALICIVSPIKDNSYPKLLSNEGQHLVKSIQYMLLAVGWLVDIYCHLSKYGITQKFPLKYCILKLARKIILVAAHLYATDYSTWSLDAPLEQAAPAAKRLMAIGVENILLRIITSDEPQTRDDDD